MGSLIIVTLLLLAAPWASAAEGSWTVCNRSGKDVQVSIAYVNPGSRGGFISEGWWKLRACGGCAMVLKRDETSDPRNVFLHVENTDGVVVTSGNSRMCTASFKHTIVGNDNCVKRGFKDGWYKHLDSVNLDKRHTTNIRGPGCID